MSYGFDVYDLRKLYKSSINRKKTEKEKKKKKPSSQAALQVGDDIWDIDLRREEQTKYIYILA